MKIKLLDIKGFGRFVNKRVIPGDTFNIVFGRNESGKSTLQAFIKAMLYGLRARKTKESDRSPLRQYKPWKGDQYAGIMEYVLENGAFFRVGRNFEKNTINIHDASANNITSQFPTDKEQGARFADEHLAVNEAIFEKSVFLRQMQSAIEPDGRKSIIERLSNLITSGSEELSLTNAISALEAANLEWVGTERSSKRPLDQVHKKIFELEIKRSNIQQAMEQHLDSWRELNNEKDRLVHLKNQLGELAGKKEAALKSRLAQLKNDYKAAQASAMELEGHLEQLQIRLSELAGFERLQESMLDEVNRLWYELCQIENELAGFEKEEADIEEKLASYSKRVEGCQKDELKAVKFAAAARSQQPAGREIPKRKYAYLPIVFIILAAITGLIAMVIEQAFIRWILIPIFAISLLMGAYLLIRKNPKNSAESEAFMEYMDKLLDYDCLIETINKDKYKLKNKRRERLVRKNQILERMGSLMNRPDLGPDVKKLEQEMVSFKALFKEYWEGKRQLELWEGSHENYQERMSMLLREASSLTGGKIRTQNELMAEPLTDELAGHLAIPDLEDTSFSLQAQIKNSEIKIKELEVKLENMPPEGALALIDEEISSLLVTKHRLEGIGFSMTEAIDCLKTVGKEMQRNHTPALNREMSQIMAEISHGRYANIKTDDAFKLMLEVPESEDYVPLELLSHGTVDQVYLAMRLAAVKLLEQNSERLPLFMDEPFAQYDEERTKSALELLKRMAEGRQIFFFTCRKRELELAQQVFKEACCLIELS